MSRPRFFIESEYFCDKYPVVDRLTLDEGDIVFTYKPRVQFSGATAHFFCKGLEQMDFESGANCYIPLWMAKKFRKQRYAEISAQTHDIGVQVLFIIFYSIGIEISHDDEDLKSLALNVPCNVWQNAKKLSMLFERGQLSSLYMTNKQQHVIRFHPQVISSASTVEFLLKNACWPHTFQFDVGYIIACFDEPIVQNYDALALLENRINAESFPVECKFYFQWTSLFRPLEPSVCFKYDENRIETFKKNFSTTYSPGDFSYTEGEAVTLQKIYIILCESNAFENVSILRPELKINEK